MGLMKVMRKYVLKVLTIFILLFGIFINSPNYSFSFDYENGQFETINSNLSIQGCPVKLKDGRILILDIDKNYIFDPKTNKFKETKPTPFGFSYFFNGKTFPATVLPDGNVLIIGNILEAPSEQFEDELLEPLKNIFMRDEYRNNPKFTSLSMENRNSIIVSHYKKYRSLTEGDKEKLYLPIIKKDPNLLSRYNHYCQLREKSRRALLFDPNTETFKPINEFRIINENYSNRLTLFVKPDGKVLVFSRQGFVYQYDFTNKKFDIMNSDTKLKNIEDIQQLNNNELILFLYRNRYCIYNLGTNQCSNIYELPDPLSYKVTDILKLDNNKLLLIGDIDDQKIYEYDILNKKITPVYTFLFKRALESYFPLRPVIIDNKQIIIFGGLKNEYNPGLFNTSYKVSNKAEIINLQTYKSKLQSMHYINAGNRNVILDDGRVLIYGGKNNELYIPKGYKK